MSLGETTSASVQFRSNPAVLARFQSYPEPIRNRLLSLRQLILATAAEMPGLDTLEEMLKWAEPSYIAERGSAIRMNWRKDRPHHYFLYFHCKTKLVDTVRALYPDMFRFEGNRAIIFHIDDELPGAALKHCVSLSLRHHNLKHLPAWRLSL